MEKLKRACVYDIPNGCEARIKDGKVEIIESKTKGQRIKEAICEILQKDSVACELYYKYDITANEAKDWVRLQGIKIAIEKPVYPKVFTFNDVLAIQSAMAYAQTKDEQLYEALTELHGKIHDVYHIGLWKPTLQQVNALFDHSLAGANGNLITLYNDLIAIAKDKGIK